MKIPLGLLLLLPLLSGSSSTETTETTIRKLDQALGATVLRRDYDALDRFFAEDSLVTNPRGELFLREQTLDAFRRGLILYSAFTQQTERVRVYGDVAVSVGSETVVPAVPGRPDYGHTIQRRFTHVWKKQSDGWRLSVRHASLLEPPAGGPAAR